MHFSPCAFKYSDIWLFDILSSHFVVDIFVPVIGGSVDNPQVGNLSLSPYLKNSNCIPYHKYYPFVNRLQ